MSTKQRYPQQFRILVFLLVARIERATCWIFQRPHAQFTIPHYHHSFTCHRGKRVLSYQNNEYDQNDKNDMKLYASPSTAEIDDIVMAMDRLFPTEALDERIALSRKDGYWPYIRQGDDPPQEFVYGEFDLHFFYSSLQRAQELLRSDNNRSGSKETTEQVFCDLGSGAGRLVLTAAASYPWKLCRGIELLRGIHDQAVEKLQECRISGSPPPAESRKTSTTPKQVSSSPNAFSDDPYWKQYQQYTANTNNEEWMAQLVSNLDDDGSNTNDPNDTTELLLPPIPTLKADQNNQDESPAALSTDGHFQTERDGFALPLWNDGDEETTHTPRLPLAPIDLQCASFEDPYQFFGDSDIIFCFSSCMSANILAKLATSIGQQCQTGTLVLTTEYSLPLSGFVEQSLQDPQLPFGPFEFELLESTTGTCDAVGGQSTVHFHRLVQGLGTGQPFVRPTTISVSDMAYQAVVHAETNRKTQRFLRNVSNEMVFLGLPDSWRPTILTGEEDSM